MTDQPEDVASLRGHRRIWRWLRRWWRRLLGERDPFGDPASPRPGGWDARPAADCQPEPHPEEAHRLTAEYFQRRIWPDGARCPQCGSGERITERKGGFRRCNACNAAGEYARGPASKNSIESVWAVLKRGLHGVYHHASPKHLGRYVDEFAWRLQRRRREAPHAGAAGQFHRRRVR